MEEEKRAEEEEKDKEVAEAVENVEEESVREEEIIPGSPDKGAGLSCGFQHFSST